MPALLEIPHKLCKLEPGDCVYLPKKILHHVRSYGRSFAVNVFWWKFKHWDKNDIIPLKQANMYEFVKHSKDQGVQMLSDFYP